MQGVVNVFVAFCFKKYNEIKMHFSIADALSSICITTCFVNSLFQVTIANKLQGTAYIILR